MLFIIDKCKVVHFGYKNTNRDVNGFLGPEFTTLTRVVKYPNLPDPWFGPISIVS